MLIFLFRINNNHIRAQHQAAQNFQFDRIAFAGAGSGKNDRVGILQRKTVKQNQTVVVAIDAVQNSADRWSVRWK